MNTSNDYYGNAAGALTLIDSDMFGSLGLVIYGGPTYATQMLCNRINSATSNSAVLITAGQGGTTASAHTLIGNTFSNSGGATVPTIAVQHNNFLTLVGNDFFDTRTGGLEVNNHVYLGSDANPLLGGIIEGNRFRGQGALAIGTGTLNFGPVIIGQNVGWSETVGKIALPFSNSGLRINPFGNTAAPTASATAVVQGCDVMLSSTGGTGVSITITDPAANTVASGLTTYVGILPMGYSINFGAFSGAPTLYVGVV